MNVGRHGPREPYDVRTGEEGDRVIGRRVRRALRRRSPVTPVELRVQLPLLWPAGPDGPIDPHALRLLAEEYGRAGRRVDDLLDDLALLCDVVGIDVSSAVLETSSVAWSEALLSASAGEAFPGAPPAEEPIEAVQRRLLAYARAADWGGPTPAGSLVTVGYPSWEGVDEGLRAIDRQVRAVFPEAVTAAQPQLTRLVAAVAAHPDLDHRVATLRSRCRELVASSDGADAHPVVRLEPVPADAAALDQVLRRAG